jgi:hypothetical protein
MIQASIAGNENNPAMLLAGIAGEPFMARTKTAILIGQTRDLPDPPPGRRQDFTLAPTPWGQDKN